MNDKNNPRKIRHCLPLANMLKLCDWVRTNQAHATVDLAIQAASQELGFKVGPANMRSAEKAAGFQFPRVRAVFQRSPQRPEDAAPIRDRAGLVATVLLELMLKLGEPVPEALYTVASRKPLPKAN